MRQTRRYGGLGGDLEASCFTKQPESTQNDQRLCAPTFTAHQPMNSHVGFGLALSRVILLFITNTMTTFNRGHWHQDEHQRFLEALRHFPQGPWADIAKYVGTRSARQVQTHANKYYEKIERHVRGLQRDRSRCGAYKDLSYGESATEHEIDLEILNACSKALETGMRLPTPSQTRDDSEDDDDDGGELLPVDQSLDFLIEWLSSTM